MTAPHSQAYPELVNWIRLLAELFSPSAFSDFLLRWEKALFSAVVIALIGVFAFIVSRRLKLIPDKRQSLMELVIGGLDQVVCGVIGSRGRTYTPFLGSLFIYLFVSNLFGLVPLQNSATAFLTTTAPIALCVFFYVQWVGITQNGLLGYLYHMAGSPRDIVSWFLTILMFPLHLLGEFIKPLSLSFRLYGNIMAGHVLLAVFLTLGIRLLAPLRIPAGVPLHLPFLFLEIMIGTIQAFVFTILSTVYIAMMLPSEEH